MNDILIPDPIFFKMSHQEILMMTNEDVTPVNESLRSPLDFGFAFQEEDDPED